MRIRAGRGGRGTGPSPALAGLLGTVPQDGVGTPSQTRTAPRSSGVHPGSGWHCLTQNHCWVGRGVRPPKDSSSSELQSPGWGGAVSLGQGKGLSTHDAWRNGGPELLLRLDQTLF